MAKGYMKDNFSFIITVVVLVAVITGGILYINVGYKGSKYEEQPVASFELNGDKETVVDREEVIKYKHYSETVLQEGASVVDIARKAGPSIVGIRTTIAGFEGGLLNSGTEVPIAEGSGIIISEDGYILTNYHVVQFADTDNAMSGNIVLEVFLPDGRQCEASFIGGDKKEDLAVIRIGLEELSVAELGDSSKLEVGEQVVAIGNPLGIELAGSVTVGYVSALNRIIPVGDIYLRLIQTDAAINPGNSGGALVNSKGKVIGINSVKITVEGVEGLGFAIPVNDAKEIAEQLVLYGEVINRADTGITGKEVTQVVSRILGIPAGVFVMDVASGSGAEKAGVRKGDVIVSLDGRPVKTTKDLYTIEKEHLIGDTLEAVIIRKDKRIDCSITIQ